jgi:hypothetical protein
MKRLIKTFAACSALSLTATIVVASPAAALQRMTCNGSDYWKILNYGSTQQVCFAYSGFSATLAIYDVDSTDSGNNTGWEDTVASLDQGYTVYFPKKDDFIDFGLVYHQELEVDEIWIN